MNQEEIKKIIDTVDEDLKPVIEYMLLNGFKTMASCDGVLAHHPKDRVFADAYISLENSKLVCDLVAYLYENSFDFDISTKTSTEKFWLYNNLTFGDKVSIRFINYNSENSQKLNNLLHDFIELKKRASEHTLKYIMEVYECLNKNDDSSNICFVYNSGLSCYQPYMNKESYMKKEGRSATLIIGKKDGCCKDMYLDEIAKFIENKFQVKYKMASREETFDESMFSVKVGKNSLNIYFEKNKYKEILEVVKEIKQREKENL